MSNAKILQPQQEDKQFKFNDIIKILGYREQYLFEVQSMTYIQYNGKQESYERHYNCKNLSNGDIHIGYPSDMLLIKRDDTNEKNIKNKIDNLLDKYNDQMVLYDLLKDESYKEVADGILCLIEQESKKLEI